MGSKGEQLFYKKVCLFYENQLSSVELKKEIDELIDQNDIDSHFSIYVEPLINNYLSLDDKDSLLYGIVDPIGRRYIILRMLGYRPREADDIIFQTKTSFFHINGRRQPPLNIDYSLAITLAAFLEAPTSYFQGSKVIEKTPWYYVSDDNSREVDVYINQFLKSNFVRGRLKLEGITDDIGIVLLRSKSGNYSQISLSVNKLYAVENSDWNSKLMWIANKAGLNDFGIYTSAEPFFCPNQRIHRLTFIKQKNERTKSVIYCRIFSGRTEEVMIGNTTIKKPLSDKFRVLAKLNEEGIL